jgi:ribosomal protein S18 acetylase RimI-like enzyme
MIETLDGGSRTDLVEIFALAFSSHPLLPPDPTGRGAGTLAASLLDAFAAAPDARRFGIRRDGQLDCAAFVFDAAYEPRTWARIALLFRVVRVVGWRTSRAFAQVLAARSHSAERQLELSILGTRPDCQGQGLGRVMLRHVLDFARGQGYQSVVLEVAKDTPACGFYRREGFLIEREIALSAMPLSLLRRPLAA